MATLRNGAREVCRVTRDNLPAVVLAETGGAMPWATWTVDDDGNCYHGHYFKTRDEGAADLLRRAF